MKVLQTAILCALATVALAIQSYGQIQVAGTLLINIDPSGLPLGPAGWVTNSGTASGVFEATGLATANQPVIVAVGGGANGIMFDGNNFMQQVTAPGGAKLNLPAALGGVNAPYSIECWVMNPTTWVSDAETMVYWGVRGTAGYQTAFSYSANAGQGAMDHWGNNLNWLLLPALAQWHHLVYTFDGATQKAYVDGVLDISTPVTGILNPVTTQPITLAAQRNSDGSLTGAGGVRGSLTLGKVRIHSGVLTAAQVAMNYNLEKAAFVMAPAYVSAKPIHRYTFGGLPLADAVGQTLSDIGTPGGANGIVRGTAGSASLSGSKLLLTGGSSATAPYVDLPNGLLSNLSVSNGGPGKITLEGWVTVVGGLTWPRLFDFGSTTIGEVTTIGGTFNGVNYFTLAQNYTYRNWARCEIMNNGYNGGPNVTTTRDFGLENDSSASYGLTHYAVTWDEASGEVIVYENGAEATRFVTTTKFNGINDVNVWLGRSAWSADNNLLGDYDEFRMYNRVLSAGEVQNDYQAGPNAVASDPGALQAIHLPMPHTNLLAGASDQLVVYGDYLTVFNQAVRGNPGFIYSSSDTNVVTVSSNGLLQAVGVGTATVSVALSSLSDSNVVTVITDPGALLAVRLVVTNKVQLFDGKPAVVRGDFANVTDVDLLSYGSPVLVSANTNLLTVDSFNRIIAIGPGTTTLTATYGGLSATQSVTVTFPTNRFIFDTFGDGFWTIVNQGNSNTLVAGSSGASQEVFTNGATEQQFELLYNLQNSTFRVRNRASWLCIGPQNDSPAVGGAVTTIPVYTGTNAEQWYFVDVGGGAFRIVNALSGLVLQTDNGNPANVALAPVSNSPLQFWRFVYQTHYPKKGTGGYGDFYATFQQSWAYNWGYGTSWILPPSSVFEPMQWGNWSVDTSTYGAWHSTEKPIYLMGFNEPDNASQANMTVAQAITLWPQLQNMNVPLLSPATQNTYASWIYNFFNQAANRGYRVDYTAVHLYINPDAAALINNLQNVYNTWGRPVWLTEFSPVDWTGTATWSEQDNYNFLAEFMWQAEDQLWLKRYALFPFSGTPSTNPWDANGHRGDTFLANGVTLTPYGELFATWDADRTLHARMPYLIQNLATSFRLTSSNSVSAPRASSIRVRDATTEWALLPVPTTNHWYIISLNDGRRLRDTLGTLDLAPVGTVGSLVEWAFTGPDSKGYYYIGNPAFSHNLNGTGTAPSVTFTTVSVSTTNNNTRWRLIKPYQPVSILAATVPGTLSATPSNQNVTLSWSGGNRFYNVYRGTATGGPYTRIATTLTNATFIDNTVTNGVPYYYVVTGLNILGEESGYSAEAAAIASVTAAWRLQWFGTPYNTGIAADTADPDGDGIVNVLERAFNLNPTVADTNGKPAGVLNGANFILTYRKSLAATDLFFQVMRSFDLIQWSTNGVTDMVVSSDGSTEIHTASVPLSNGRAQFLRLQVTAP
jgi:hypothetical protein